MPLLPENLRALRGPILGGVLLFVLGATGIVWLSIAAVESAAAMLGPIWAPATIGAVLLTPLAIAALLAWMKARRQAASLLTAGGADASLAAVATAAHKMMDKSPLAALALASLAGLLVTRYPVGLSLLASILSADERT